MGNLWELLLEPADIRADRPATIQRSCIRLTLTSHQERPGDRVTWSTFVVCCRTPRPAAMTPLRRRCTGSGQRRTGGQARAAWCPAARVVYSPPSAQPSSATPSPQPHLSAQRCPSAAVTRTAESSIFRRMGGCRFRRIATMGRKRRFDHLTALMEQFGYGAASALAPGEYRRVTSTGPNRRRSCRRRTSPAWAACSDEQEKTTCVEFTA